MWSCLPWAVCADCHCLWILEIQTSAAYGKGKNHLLRCRTPAPNPAICSTACWLPKRQSNACNTNDKENKHFCGSWLIELNLWENCLTMVLLKEVLDTRSTWCTSTWCTSGVKSQRTHNTFIEKHLPTHAQLTCSILRCLFLYSFTTSVKQSYARPFDQVYDETCTEPWSANKCTRHR